MQGVKNIIFDLGGVILDIDIQKTAEAFREMGIPSFSEMFTQHYSNNLFVQLETGAISPEAFYEAFRNETGMSLADDAIKDAWNALLLDFRKPSLEWLDSIKDKYQIFLFSNTNQIHHDAFIEKYQQQTGKSDFDAYFRKAYYSQQIGMRKPDLAPFLHILQEQNLVAAETLFIDDTIKNIIAAQQAGMQTVHLQWPQTLPDLDL